MAVSGIPVLKVENISKRFGAVQALNKVGFELYPGEVHALMGENGAGKSTVVKIISGIYSEDEGRIEFEGREVKVDNPAAAIKLGISIVMQEFNSMPHLSVYENIFLGHNSDIQSEILNGERAGHLPGSFWHIAHFCGGIII